MNNMIEELRVLDEECSIFNTISKYVIPRYQRAYAWEDKEIIQLIDDISGIGSSDNYYIGSLVVSRVKGKPNTFEVVDGQQRLTTLYILLQYLFFENIINERIEHSLSFDCRANSNFTLSHIQELIKNETLIDLERIEQSILNGLKAIRQKFSTDKNIDIHAFANRLKQVILYRIEVPENTDLNRYFEIMNTRGEQLEQHDILKAQLMEKLSTRKEQNFFARIWDACSDMTGYVQMHLSKFDRETIFGQQWNEYPSDDWEDYSECYSHVETDTESHISIKNIVAQNFVVNDIDGYLDDDSHIRFDSIIDFPYFLLHTIRVFVKINEIQLKQPFGDLLDDKKLIADFKNVLNSKVLNARQFSKHFLIFLLQSRYLFDTFFIKREYTGEDTGGEWSLKELHTSGQQSKKKAYYKNTSLRKESERETTSAVRFKESLMIQSALRVSYTSPKVMHWITDMLEWLFSNDWDSIYLNLAQTIENIAVNAVNENYLNAGNYNLGVKTPHIVFNLLDYILWKNDKKKYADFNFEFRNSVEHWYPQNPSDGSFEFWDNKDTFGNLCIISRRINSKFSNLSPESKMKSYSKMVRKGSLKLRIMGEIIGSCTNEEWKQSKCDEHEREMIDLLEGFCSQS